MAKVKKKETLTPEERLQAALVPNWEQPYKVPENWCWTTQNTVATFFNGRAYKQNELLEDNTKTPVLRVGNLFTNSSWYYSNLELDSDKYIDSGDLIYAWSASFGPFLWTGNKVIYHYHIWKIILSSAVQKKYMYFWLLYDTERLKQGGHGTGMIHVTKAMMEAAFFPLPPFLEQQRIVDRIESLFTKLDEAKQKVQDVLDSSEIRKAAILHKAFTGRLTARWRKEQGLEKAEWLGEKLKNCITLLSGRDFSPDKYNSEEKGIPYITGASNFENSHVCINRWTEEPSVVAKKGDVLLVCKGSGYGKTIIADFEYAHIARQIMSLRVTGALSNKFLLYYLQNNIRYIRESGQGLIPGISRKIVLDMEISLPSIDEQTEIVHIIDDFSAKEQQAKENAEMVLEQIDLIKKSILSRAFRGELGTNDPNEESSIELLKRSFLETIEFGKVKSKQVNKRKAEVVFMHKTIMEALSKGARLTPEKLKSETQLPIDDFYAQLKELIDNGNVAESRENGESYLEAVNENRQTEN